MKTKRLALVLWVAVLLTACAPAATAEPTLLAATTTSAPASPPPAMQTPAADGQATTTGDDVRVYRIIPEQSRASYEVGEIFINQNNQFNLAVGTTSAIRGDVLLNFTDPRKSTTGEINVDISTLASDSGRRDNAIRSNWLESSRFPTAKFVTTSVEGLPEQYSMGSEIQFKLNGDLTVRDVTQPVSFDVTARLENDTLSGAATTQVLMTDFGFDPPDIAGMLKANNEAKITLQFVAAQ